MVKFNYELAIKLRDEYFTEEEKKLLSSVIGSAVIDVADQLISSYGNYCLRDDENTFLKRFATIKYREGRYIIQQIQLLEDKLEELMNPEKNIDTEIENSNDDNTGIKEIEKDITEDSTAGEYRYNFEESSVNNDTALLNRTANTQTSQKDNDIEKKWKNTPFIEIKQNIVGKKEINIDAILNKDKKLEIKNTHYNVEPQEVVENSINAELYSTVATNVIGERGSIYSGKGVEHMEINRIDSKEFDKIDEYESGTVVRYKNTITVNKNKANLTSIKMRIPDLQSKFFGLFFILFKLW